MDLFLSTRISMAQCLMHHFHRVYPLSDIIRRSSVPWDASRSTSDTLSVQGAIDRTNHNPEPRSKWLIIGRLKCPNPFPLMKKELKPGIARLG